MKAALYKCSVQLAEQTEKEMFLNFLSLKNDLSSAFGEDKVKPKWDKVTVMQEGRTCITQPPK